MAKDTKENFILKAFDIGVVLKGIDGALEMIGGILLLVIKPQTINTIVKIFTQHELSEDPNDFFANQLIQAAQHLSLNSKLFGGYYLLSHGIMKIIIVIGLLMNKLWAYKLGIIFLIISIFYQSYRLFLRYSNGMLLLTLFDIVIIWLIWHEYRRQISNPLSGDRWRT